ncbi:adhesion G-protein coupled receptor G1 isoform 2-T2 [Pholidichthys leucotaenia]
MNSAGLKSAFNQQLLSVVLTMELRRTRSLKVVLLLIILCTAFCENDLDSNFCGTWRHGNGPLSLKVNLSSGCSGISISANKSSLSINGQLTSYCRRVEELDLNQFGLHLEEDSDFCVYWEPLLDQLKLEVAGKNLILCWPGTLRELCCTDLSPGTNTAEVKYGIFNGRVKNDPLSSKIHTAYNFDGRYTNCKELCEQANQGNLQNNMLAEHPCTQRTVVGMPKGFRGHNITSQVLGDKSAEPAATVYLPPALKQAATNMSKAVCTFFTNNSLFQEVHKKSHTEVKILNIVVEITVAKEIIKDLSEPIRINFHHDVIPKGRSRKCVSWDTRKDPLLVNWVADGCETQQKGPDHTECLCNHLTYFTVLVEMEPRPVRHLLALTIITYLGCAASAISCVALIVYLFRKRRQQKEQSTAIHLGLAVSLAFLALLFFFTGILANVNGESVCPWVGAILHYWLLSSLTWMGIEVFHTFWLVYLVFTPSPKPYIWHLVGFVLPALPVIVLAAVGDIYGLREVMQTQDPSDPYLMCWMKTNNKAFLAHCFTTMTVLVLLVLSGFVMLCQVYMQIRTRDEWRERRVAFLSIWGLSCLFGSTWGLTFLNFNPLSEVVLFLSCILNSFQGFFLMLRFCLLGRMRKQGGGSSLGSTSSGSTRQHMLSAQEKSYKG